MVERNIKQILVENLSSLVPNLTDAPPEKPTKSYVLMELSDAFDVRFKRTPDGQLRQMNSYLTFHIFSVYNGEKEVLEIKDIIDNAMENLYSLGEVSYFEMSGFNIINEEKPLRKHGVLRYRILSTY
jgi:hypothetical protein